MKKLVLLTLALALTSACTKDRTLEAIVTAKDGAQGPAGKDGSSCSVSNILEEDSIIGALIACTDGSWSQIFNGKDGSVGESGQSCTVHRGCEEDFVTITCGEYSARVYDGEEGPQGESIQGPQGESGSSGQSCYQSGTTTQTLTYRDYTVLPVAGVTAVPASSAYCSKGSSTHNTTASNCNQWNCDNNGHNCVTKGNNYWTFHPAVPGVAGVAAVAAEYTDRTVTVTIPTFTCGYED
jgi:hypothetical protein